MKSKQLLRFYVLSSPVFYDYLQAMSLIGYLQMFEFDLISHIFM